MTYYNFPYAKVDGHDPMMMIGGHFSQYVYFI